MGDNLNTTLDLLLAEEAYSIYKKLTTNGTLCRHLSFDELPDRMQETWVSVALKVKELTKPKASSPGKLIKLGNLFIRADQIKTIAVTEKNIVIHFGDDGGYIYLKDKASLVCLLNALGGVDSVPITPGDEQLIRERLGSDTSDATV